MLPTDKDARKGIPIYSGFFAYFPNAIAAVAELSRIGNDQHNPGKPLHWDRSKSGDEKDALLRHLLDQTLLGDAAGDTDGVLHATKKAWRAMADLEKILEKPQTATAKETLAPYVDKWRGVEAGKFEKYADPKEDPWVKGYRDWEGTLRFPAGPKVPKAEPQWFDWQGDICPVQPDMLVETKQRDGFIIRDRAKNFRWKHLGIISDIVAYRESY